jgi:hypothetical protein
LGWVSAIDSNMRTIWIADADRHGKRFVVPGDEKLTAFVELNRNQRSKGWLSRKRRVSRLWPDVRLKSYRQLSGVVIQVHSITSPDVSTHLRRGKPG